MPEITLTTFLSKYLSLILALIAGAFGYGKLNSKVEAQKERVDTLENGLTATLREIKEDLKDVRSSVAETKKSQHELHVEVLKSLNK